MDINDILQGRKLEDLPDGEKLIAMRYALTPDEILEAWKRKQEKSASPHRPGPSKA